MLVLLSAQYITNQGIICKAIRGGQSYSKPILRPGGGEYGKNRRHSPSAKGAGQEIVAGL